ncbi:MAG: hypothetical protein PVI75_02765 [Gammaproteobacteria bacterium]|jgi:hypothetical protein
MKKGCKIIFGLLLVFFVSTLFGCAIERTNYRPIQTAISKKSSIGVMSFLGNKVTVCLMNGLLPKKHAYELSRINYDNYLSDSIKQVLGQKGMMHVFAYHLPKNNPIASETRGKIIGRFRKIQSFELKYIKSKIKDKKFDYVIIILPSSFLTDAGLICRYGIFDNRSFLDEKGVAFYATYRIYVLDGKNFNIVSQKYEDHFIAIPGFTLDWKKDLPLITNQQRGYYRLWLLNVVGDDIKKNVLKMLSLIK